MVNRILCTLPLFIMTGSIACSSHDAGQPDASVTPDGPIDTDTIHISSAGQDLDDGYRGPVKTLGFALLVAQGRGNIKTIRFDSGAYSPSSGEHFPYQVPSNLAIVGPADGVAVLVGGNGFPDGLILAGTGSLENLEFERFRTAIKAMDVATLTNIHVRESGVAVSGSNFPTAKLTITNLDVDGVSCGFGIGTGGAELVATRLAIRSVAVAVSDDGVNLFNGTPRGNIEISDSNFTGSPRCTSNILAPLISIRGSESVAINGSTLVGGDDGILFDETFGLSTHAVRSVANTTVSNMKNSGIIVNDSEVSLAGSHAVSNGVGIETRGGTFTMRNSTVSRNVFAGVSVEPSDACDGFVVDLGTTAAPGNNTLQQNTIGNTGRNLDVRQCLNRGAFQLIQAVGNVWDNGQGTDSTGRYASVATVTGPIDGVNYRMGTGGSLQR